MHNQYSLKRTNSELRYGNLKKKHQILNALTKNKNEKPKAPSTSTTDWLDKYLSNTLKNES